MIGLTASLEQLIGSVIKVLGYLNDVKHAPRERKELCQETHDLLGLLMNLRDKIEIADRTSPWYDQFRSLGRPEGPLERYKKALGDLVKLLVPDKGFKGLGKHLVWPLDKKKIYETLALTERLKTLISIALQEDNLSVPCLTFIIEKFNTDRLRNQCVISSDQAGHCGPCQSIIHNERWHCRT